MLVRVTIFQRANITICGEVVFVESRVGEKWHNIKMGFHENVPRCCCTFAAYPMNFKFCARSYIGTKEKKVHQLSDNEAHEKKKKTKWEKFLFSTVLCTYMAKKKLCSS